MRGSLVKLSEAGGVITELKKTSVSALITPSATPFVLLNVRIRPLTATIYCDGPTAPIESGGKACVSLRVAPRKLTPVVCGVYGPPPVPGWPAVGRGKIGVSGESGFGRIF